MREVSVIADHMISSLGFSTEEHLKALRQCKIGLKRVHDPLLYPNPVQVSLVNTARMEEQFTKVCDEWKNSTIPSSFTRLEKMLIITIHEALRLSGLHHKNPKMIFVLSSTKGNIELLEERYHIKFPHQRLFIWELAKVLGSFFKFHNQPVIISQACISGSVAIMHAARMIKSGQFDHALVAGGDIISEFVISGFMSFQALSSEPCKPFDQSRNGLNLGEGAGTMILSTGLSRARPRVVVAGGATTNDANHISGPSRTGEELSLAINRSIKEARLQSESIDYISAHGTATSFNDEMESKAYALSGLSGIPLNSYKGYWGHTLGAAGILESIAAIHSLMNNELYPSPGFEIPGVPETVKVIRSHQKTNLHTCLKTASGFGGCNASLVFRKY
jgi:3-oxoacyl-[acyl-carrier-protein] synthase-1